MFRRASPGQPRRLAVAIDARLADYTVGGIAQYTLQLARALARLGGAEYTLLRAARPRERPAPVPGLRERRLWTPPHHRLEQWTLPAELLALRPDVLHSPDFIPPFRRTYRSVITVHDLAFLRHPETMTPDSHRYYDQIARAVQSTDRVIAVSNATRRDIVELLGVREERISVVPHGVDPAFSLRSAAEQRQVREQYGLEGRFLLWVGTFEPRKNLPTLLRAFQEVRERHSDLTLALVGRRGWLDSLIFEMLQTPPYNRGVRVLEQVPRGDLPGLFSAASAFVFPSLYEGFGLPLLEAMACETPIVAANTSSLPEVLGSAGLLVSPLDPAQLASAILRVLEDYPLAAELRKRGLLRVSRFTWERTARQTLEIYRQVAA